MFDGSAHERVAPRRTRLTEKTVRFTTLLMLAGTVSIAACAPRTSRSLACDAIAEPAVNALPVYRDCGVDRAARPTGTMPRPEYTFARGQSCVRAQIDVVIDTLGRPLRQTARVVKSTDPSFTDALLATFDRRRFEPALRGGRPVQQVVRINEAAATRTVVVPAGVSPTSVRPPRGPLC